MTSRKLIILSLSLLPLSLFGETASDYVHRGAQKYIFAHEDEAEAEVSQGLAKFPNDPELREMTNLFRKQKQQQNDQSQRQQKKQQQQSSQNQQQNNQQDQQQEEQ